MKPKWGVNFVSMRNKIVGAFFLGSVGPHTWGHNSGGKCLYTLKGDHFL